MTQRKDTGMKALVLTFAALLTTAMASTANATPERIPAPTIDVPAKQGLQVAILAGGCFWDLTGVFENVRGVKSVTSGYAGGSRETATYEQVMTERTRHAEAVRITYDPHLVSYGTLLRIFFSVAHDPTSINRQGELRGPAYRSAIFPLDGSQRRVAETYIARLDKAHAFAKPIVTHLEDGQFYTAEAYHQRYCSKHPRDPYVVSSVAPKILALRAAYSELAV